MEAHRMSDIPKTRAVRRCLADLVALEGAIETALAGQMNVVDAHPGAAAAVQRFHARAQSQRMTLSEHLAGVGGQDTAALRPADPARHVPPAGVAADAHLPISEALRADYTAFHHAALGYGLLWGIAHRAYAERTDQPTFRLAEQHQRAYAEAAHEIIGLLADVLAWELTRSGEPCDCLCPSCRDMGLCICTAGARSVTIGNLAETALRDERGAVVRQLRPGGPADRGGLVAGDVIVGVDGQEVPDTWKLNPLLGGFRAGQAVRLRVDSPDGATREVTVSP
jgi:hypothetical protein